jgi:hypothetical protein
LYVLYFLKSSLDLPLIAADLESATPGSMPGYAAKNAAATAELRRRGAFVLETV